MSTMTELPIYCPIKGFAVDINKIKQELDLLARPLLKENTLSFKNNRSIYDKNSSLNIADDADLVNTDHWAESEDGSRVFVEGKNKTYHAVNLTYLPEEPDSTWNIWKSEAKKPIFWHIYKKPFTWREEWENTYLKKFINSLPFEYVQGVRVLIMDPPSIGQAHKDSATILNKKFLESGHASISINVDSGGGILKYLDNKEESHEVDNNTALFHFDDSAVHGVTPISSSRYQIRIWGKLNVPYKDILDLDNAVYR
jgi:hypothetical protein